MICLDRVGLAIRASFISVAIYPGAMELTLIPLDAHSFDMALTCNRYKSGCQRPFACCAKRQLKTYDSGDSVFGSSISRHSQSSLVVQQASNVDDLSPASSFIVRRGGG